MKSDRNSFLIFAVAALAIATLGLIGQSDYEMELESEKYYCEMVSQFNETKHLDRDSHRGHPDYKGIYQEVCVKYARK
jgi:hypothetical protein